MGFRFRKSFGPRGFKVNLSKNGISSVSIGGAPFTVNLPVSRRGGVRATAGIPGTGLSWSEQWPRAGASSAPDARAALATSGVALLLVVGLFGGLAYLVRPGRAPEVEPRSAAGPPPQALGVEVAPSSQQARRQRMNADGYFQGPKGGCFTYSGSGRKNYVDRSVCASY